MTTPDALARENGTFLMVAMDQRESLRTMLAERGRDAGDATHDAVQADGRAGAGGDRGARKDVRGTTNEGARRHRGLLRAAVAARRTARPDPRRRGDCACAQSGLPVGGGAAVPIPLRSLRPRREDCERLLVPVCVSASHVALGSVRTEPTLMLLGQAAGTCAALAARAGCAVQEVDAHEVRQRL